MGDWRDEKIPEGFQGGAFCRDGDELEVMTEGFHRRDVFFLIFFTECGQRDSVVSGKVLQAVVDNDRAADDFCMREFFAGKKDFHNLPECFLQNKFHNQKSPKKENEEQKSKEVEVFIDEALDSWSKFPDQTGNHEETKRPADGRCDKKKSKVELEYP